MSNDYIEDMKKLLAEGAHQLEHAEADAERINDLVKRIGALEIVPGAIFLGKNKKRPYEDLGRSDSSQIMQAVLLIPAGLGVCYFDMEEYGELQCDRNGLEREANRRFIPFMECGPAERAFLGQDVELFKRFVDFSSRFNILRHAATDCGVSLSNETLSREGLYD